jgi:hypothetical protein
MPRVMLIMPYYHSTIAAMVVRNGTLLIAWSYHNMINDHHQTHTHTIRVQRWQRQKHVGNGSSCNHYATKPWWRNGCMIKRFEDANAVNINRAW